MGKVRLAAVVQVAAAIGILAGHDTIRRANAVGIVETQRSEVAHQDNRDGDEANAPHRPTTPAQSAAGDPNDDAEYRDEENLRIQQRIGCLTFILAGAAVIQAVVVIVQAVLADRTLKTIARQVNLQAVAMRQWVEVRLSQFEDVGRLRDESGGPLPSRQVEITFEVVNRTPYPLTFKKIKADVRHVGPGEGVILQRVEERRLIPGECNASRIGFLIQFKLSDDKLTEYRHQLLAYAITGVVVFVAATGVEEQQEFGFLADVGRAEAVEVPYVVDMLREEEDEDKEQSG